MVINPDLSNHESNEWFEVDEIKRFYQDLIDEKRDVDNLNDEEKQYWYYKRFIERIRRLLNRIQLDEDACHIVNVYNKVEYDFLKQEELPYSSIIPEDASPIMQIRYYLSFVYILYEELQQQVKSMPVF